MKSLEERYAGFNPYLHFSMADPKFIASTKQSLISKTNSLLFYKKVLLSHHDNLGETLQEVSKVVNHQLEELHEVKLSLEASHNNFLASSLAEHLDAPTHDLAAVFEALQIASDHFPSGSLSAVEQALATRSMESSHVHTVMAAAHDAYHFKNLLTTLHKQAKVTVHQTPNVELLHRSLRFLERSFDDELHSLSVLHHQKLHDWHLVNAVCR